MTTEDKFLSRLFDKEDSHTLEVFEEHGGYDAFRKSLEMNREDIIEELKVSNLRGRGGAGFPAGIKWSFMPEESDGPKYLVVNADEGEPGTFKDRQIMRFDPHRMIEGCLIACAALDIDYTFIYVRGELQHEIRKFDQAIEECYEAGYLGEDILGSGFDHEMWTHPGAGAYICGEETGMIEGLEGKPGQPRNKPPFPAIIGVFDQPTLVNNVETIACVPFVIEHGGEWFADYGVEKNGGPKLYGLSGPVEKPGVYEAPSGITVGELLEDYAGGMKEGHDLKAFFPGGSSTRPLLPEHLDTPMAFEPMRELDSNLGTGCVTYIDDQTCAVRMAARLAHFYSHESCGQCTPCRDGTGWAAKVLDAIEGGRGRPEDLDLLMDMADNIEGNTICALGDSLSIPVRGLIEEFPEEFEQHIEAGGCPYPSWGLDSDESDSKEAA